jgi:hypothetical protein
MSTDACLDAAIRSVGKRPAFDGGRFITPVPLQPWHLILPRLELGYPRLRRMKK